MSFASGGKVGNTAIDLLCKGNCYISATWVVTSPVRAGGVAFASPIVPSRMEVHDKGIVAYMKLPGMYFQNKYCEKNAYTYMKENQNTLKIFNILFLYLLDLDS
jgi:hypothetical protein